MSPRKLNNDRDFEIGKRLEEERKKIWKSRKQYRQVTGLSDGTLESYEAKGVDISAKCLAAIAQHGGDVLYILTGQRAEVGDAKISKRIMAKLHELEAKNAELEEKVAELLELNISLQKERLELKNQIANFGGRASG